jgi:hypothetical protein
VWKTDPAAALTERTARIRIIGIDPGLRRTGWGVIDSDGVRLVFVACGSVVSDNGESLGARLRQIFDGLHEQASTEAHEVRPRLVHPAPGQL